MLQWFLINPRYWNGSKTALPTYSIGFQGYIVSVGWISDLLNVTASSVEYNLFVTESLNNIVLCRPHICIMRMLADVTPSSVGNISAFSIHNNKKYYKHVKIHLLKLSYFLFTKHGLVSSHVSMWNTRSSFSPATKDIPERLLIHQSVQ